MTQEMITQMTHEVIAVEANQKRKEVALKELEFVVDELHEARIRTALGPKTTDQWKKVLTEVVDVLRHG